MKENKKLLKENKELNKQIDGICDVIAPGGNKCSECEQKLEPRSYYIYCEACDFKNECI